MFPKVGFHIPAKIILCLFLLIFFFNGNSQNGKQPIAKIDWKQIETGLQYAEVNGPKVSKFSDSKVTIIKISPISFNFELILATESDSNLRTIKDWCVLKNLTGGINSGMYLLKDHVSGSGLTQNFGHFNNPTVKESFNAMAVFNPKDKSLPSFQIVDMANQDWKSVLQNYNSCFQSIRMIDNTGTPVYWKHKPVLYCSMSVLAVDKSGNVLFIFARSPYSSNEMINFMLNSDLNVKTAMYLEGGPEASIYLKNNDTEILKFGSYVSNACANDNNKELRKMPNVLGFRKK
jgi:hypothetical protein